MKVLWSIISKSKFKCVSGHSKCESGQPKCESGQSKCESGYSMCESGQTKSGSRVLVCLWVYSWLRCNSTKISNPRYIYFLYIVCLSRQIKPPNQTIEADLWILCLRGDIISGENFSRLPSTPHDFLGAFNFVQTSKPHPPPIPVSVSAAEDNAFATAQLQWLNFSFCICCWR